MTPVEFKCTGCGKLASKDKSNVTRANRNGWALYCSQSCYINYVTGKPRYLTVNTPRDKIPVPPRTKKTHCKRGHPFSEENTYQYKNGMRYCRACMKIHKRNWMGAKK